MKSRVPWIVIVVGAVLVGALFFLRERPTRPPRDIVAAPPGESPGGFTPAKVDLKMPLPKPDLVEIQDGKTIDFSSGLPIIKDSEKDKAALDRAVKEMEAAAASVSFSAPQTPAAEAKPRFTVARIFVARRRSSRVFLETL
jgi:hypothetical protein